MIDSVEISKHKYFLEISQLSVEKRSETIHFVISSRLLAEYCYHAESCGGCPGNTSVRSNLHSFEREAYPLANNLNHKLQLNPHDSYCTWNTIH